MDRLLHSTQASALQDHYQTATVAHGDSDGNGDEWIIFIESVDYVEGYVLRLRFSDGQERLLDFEPFLQQSHHPHIRQYLNQERFQQFTLNHGDLYWHDYDLCFPIADLYAGQV